MDGINNIFKNNIFASNPTTIGKKKESMPDILSKDTFKTKEENLNKEISFLLDILYNDSDENLLKKTDNLKFKSTYLPINCQKLHYDL